MRISGLSRNTQSHTYNRACVVEDALQRHPSLSLLEPQALGDHEQLGQSKWCHLFAFRGMESNFGDRLHGALVHHREYQRFRVSHL